MRARVAIKVLGSQGPYRLGALAAAADGLCVVLHKHAAGVRVVQHGPAPRLPARHQQRHAEGAALRVACASLPDSNGS